MITAREYILSAHEKHRNLGAVFRGVPDLRMAEMFRVKRNIFPRPEERSIESRRVTENTDWVSKRFAFEKQLVAAEHTRDITKKSMVHNGATPDIAVDPETYEVTADGELLTCAPAEVLPMAQRYFLF